MAKDKTTPPPVEDQVIDGSGGPLSDIDGPAIEELVDEEEDDVTWKTIIMDLCKSGKIDPWDIEVSILAQEYLKIVSKLKETNFRLS